MFKRAQKVKKNGLPIYEGSPIQVAEQIIDSCWNTKLNYFQVSAGHFCEFWSRDFGMGVEAFVNLGYREQVVQTLDYALSNFQKHGRITTTISPEQVCFDFPFYAADSLPFIMHSLKVADATELVEKYKDFLVREIQYYFENVFDKSISLIRKDKYFSSMKDYSKRHSSCYSNCMLSMLSDDITALGLTNPFIIYNIKKAIISHFWNGKFFYDNWDMDDVVTGDANTYPFWCNVTSDSKMFAQVLKSIQDTGLDKPFPLKYSVKEDKIHKMHSLEFLAGDYERDSIWIHLGVCFLEVVKKFNPQQCSIYLLQYENLLVEHKNFLEVYNSKGDPFNNLFYYSDDSMSWVVQWLSLKKDI